MAVTLVNLLLEPLEVMYDGHPYYFGPAGSPVAEMTVEDRAAAHLRKRSLIKDNPVTGEGTFALARKGVDDTSIRHQRPPELLDRTDLDDPRARHVTYVPIKNDPRTAAGATASALDAFAPATERTAVRSRRPVAVAD